MQSVVDNTGQLGIFDEGYLVYVVWLVAPHEEVLVQVRKIGRKLLSDKVSIDGSVVVFQVNNIFAAIIRGLLLYINKWIN